MRSIVRRVIAAGLLLSGVVVASQPAVAVGPPRIVDPRIQSVAQSSTGWGGVAAKAFDGNRDGLHAGGSVSHTSGGDASPSMTVVFRQPRDLKSVVVWNRTDKSLGERLDGVQISVSNVATKCGVGTFKQAKPIVANRSTKRVEVAMPRFTTGVRTVCFEKDDKFMSFAEIEFVDHDRRPKPDWVEVTPGGGASQSSVSFGGRPAKAVDGNTNGAHRGGSVSHTAREEHAWWQVDLGRPYKVENVRLFNRTDCCSERLSQFYILASESPIPNTYPEAIDANGVTAVYVAKMPDVRYSADWGVNLGGITARYIKVMVLEEQFLSLAEVQVWADTSDDCNTYACRTASSSSNAPGSTADLAIDGNYNGDFNNGSVFSSAAGDSDPWWNMTFGEVHDVNSLAIHFRTDAFAGEFTGAVKLYASPTEDNACLDPKADWEYVFPFDHPLEGQPTDGLTTLIPGASFDGTLLQAVDVKSLCLRGLPEYANTLNIAEVEPKEFTWYID